MKRYLFILAAFVATAIISLEKESANPTVNRNSGASKDPDTITNHQGSDPRLYPAV
jgi:hypothetical protein